MKIDFDFGMQIFRFLGATVKSEKHLEHRGKLNFKSEKGEFRKRNEVSRKVQVTKSEQKICMITWIPKVEGKIFSLVIHVVTLTKIFETCT